MQAALDGYCGDIGCIWVPFCPHLSRQSPQVDRRSFGDGQATLETSHQPQLDTLSPTSPNTPISLSSVTHETFPFDTPPIVTGEPTTEAEHTASPSPSPSTLFPQSPNLSDTDMDYEETDPENALPQGPQVNPFVDDQVLYNPFRRIQLIVSKGEETPSIKKKNKDVPKFLIEHPLPASERGKGSRGGVGSYSCVFPDCGETIARKDRAIDHVLNHFGAKPYRCTACPLRFLRKADLTRHGKRNGTCPGGSGGQPEVRPTWSQFEGFLSSTLLAYAWCMWKSIGKWLEGCRTMSR